MRKKITIIIPTILTVILGWYGAISFFLPLEIPPMPSSTVILDTHGEEMGELVYSGSIRHRDTTYDDIPVFYRESLVWLEDRGFYENNGISIRGTIRSIVRNIEAWHVVEWASTLSSQLIRNVFWIDKERTLSRKLYEILASVRLNAKYSKEEILTMYTDRISFGYLNYGLVSASEYFFGKSPNNLTEAEQIALLAIPKNPKRYDPYRNRKNLDERIRLIVRTLEAWGKITPDQSRSILAEHLSFRIDHMPRTPYVVDFLSTAQSSNKNTTLKTTLDLAMTNQIDSLAHSALSELSWRNVSDYGIIIAERTGKNPKLRVMIGGANYRESTTGQVNSTLALRQPGSTIKPFTYALAFRDLGLTPSDTILDLPVGYKTAQDYSYEPKNYSRDYRGEVTLAEALSQSINIPAVKLAERIWVGTLLEFLRSLSITSLTEDADHYGLALTLWDGEVSLYELLQAYTVFANDGVWCPFETRESITSPWEGGQRGFYDPQNTSETPWTIPLSRNSSSPFSGGSSQQSTRDRRAPLAMTNTCRSLLDRKYTDMIASILTDRYAKIKSFPIGSPLDFPDRRVFVKTGTSRNFRDNWAVGFTDHYMIGVWTGNKNAENMKWVSGATGAGELFSRIVYALEPVETEQKPQTSTTKKSDYLEVTNPIPWSVYSLDPGKSPDRQQIQLRFSTNLEYDAASWILDGKVSSGAFITPTSGSHTIEVVLMRDGQIAGQGESEFRVK